MESREPWMRLVVEPTAAGQRLDAWLAARLPGHSRRQLQSLVERQSVTVAGRLAAKGQELTAGAEVCLWLQPKPREWSPAADPDVELVIAHRDPRFLVVEKPSGLPSASLDPRERGTLAAAIVARFPECAGIGRQPGDAGLVQRLDNDTSGLVVAALDRETHDRLVALQEAGGFEKRYLALVPGRADRLPPRVALGLAPANPAGERMRPGPRQPPSTTDFRVVEILGAHLLVEAALHRGQRHQVRAHLAFSGFPICGDPLYNGAAPAGLTRLFLHASRLAFPHPHTRRPIDVSSPLPAELARVIETLRNQAQTGC